MSNIMLTFIFSLVSRKGGLTTFLETRGWLIGPKGSVLILTCSENMYG